MGMPTDIKIIDCMLGIPEAEDRSGGEEVEEGRAGDGVSAGGAGPDGAPASRP